MTLVFVAGSALVCLALFVAAWQFDSRCVPIFTPFLLIAANELLRVMPAFLYFPATGQTDLYPALLFVLAFGSLCGGYVVCASALRHSPVTAKRFQLHLISGTSQKRLLIPVLCGAALLMAAGLYLYGGVPSVSKALVGLVVGDSVEEMTSFVSESRRDITKGHIFGGAYRGQGLIRAVMAIGWPFVVSVSLSAYAQTRRRLWLLLSLVLLVLSFVFIAGDGTRAPFLNSILVYLVLWSNIRRFSVASLVKAALLIFALAISTSLYSNKVYALMDDNRGFIASALIQIGNRILLGNAVNDIFAIQFIRAGLLHYQIGSLHLEQLLASLPGVQAGGATPFANQLAQLINPGSARSTYASGTYMTKAFGDFGLVGVMLLHLAIGFAAAFAREFLYRNPRDPLQMALVAIVIYQVGVLPISGFISLMISMIVLMGVYLLCLVAHELAPRRVTDWKPTPLRRVAPG